MKKSEFTHNRKQIFQTVLITAACALLLLLGIMYAITKHFAFCAAFRIYLSLLYMTLILYWITKGLKKEHRFYKRVLWLCGIVLFLDLVVVNGVRFILSGGVDTLLFLPACAPFCAMVVVLCDTKEDNLIEKKTALWVGIPLQILSIYFEILSFIR